MPKNCILNAKIYFMNLTAGWVGNTAQEYPTTTKNRHWQTTNLLVTFQLQACRSNKIYFQRKNWFFHSGLQKGIFVVLVEEHLLMTSRKLWRFFCQAPELYVSLQKSLFLLFNKNI